MRAALGFPAHTTYTIQVSDDNLLPMMQEIGYHGEMNHIGQLKRPCLRREWSFFFDCITQTFSKKCSNWDAIPMDMLQIGYSLLYDSNFDFARYVLMNIGEKLNDNRRQVYFGRFCQLLFSECFPNVDIPQDDQIPCFKLHKRVFNDLIN